MNTENAVNSAWLNQVQAELIALFKTKEAVDWKNIWSTQHQAAFQQACPLLFHDEKGRILGVLPAFSDLRKLSPKMLKGSVEDKCLVLDIQTSRTVIMKAGEAIGLHPSQYLLLEGAAFSTLCHQGTAEIEEGKIYQGKLRGLKQMLTRLAFWRT